VDASLVPSTGVSRLYINSEIVATGSANGAGSLSATAPLFFSNINSGSNSGTVNSVFNIKTYTPRLNLGLVRQNYNALGNRLGLSSKAWIAPVTDSLLDFYPGAAAAYSLRQLSSDYEGYAIRVRNSSDQELDIGFDSNGELDTVTLLNHCGGGDGFVKTWYDQSGNGYDAAQSTAINQPQIVSGGSVISKNGNPTINFVKANYNFFIVPTLTNISQPISSFITIAYNSIPLGFDGRFIYDNNARVSVGNDNTIKQYGMFTGTSWLNSSITIDLNQKLLFTLYNGSSSIIGVNSVDTNGNAGLGSISSGFVIGKRFTLEVGYIDASLQELILYPSNQSSNRTGIETNINDFYSIY
jgi:hypothetical protein